MGRADRSFSTTSTEGTSATSYLFSPWSSPARIGAEISTECARTSAEGQEAYGTTEADSRKDRHRHRWRSLALLFSAPSREARRTGELAVDSQPAKTEPYSGRAQAELVGEGLGAEGGGLPEPLEDGVVGPVLGASDVR